MRAARAVYEADREDLTMAIPAAMKAVIVHLRHEKVRKPPLGERVLFFLLLFFLLLFGT